ncbi:16683_t:CDS:2, partial [Cetraspora pellucida]
GEEIDSGHHSVSCECDAFWKRGRPSALEHHILVDCKKVKPQVKEAVRNMIEAREKDLIKTGYKRKAIEDQESIDTYFESLALSNEQKASADNALIKLFVCAYCSPTRKTLASTLLDNEILRVHTKIYNILEKEKNLTL